MMVEYSDLSPGSKIATERAIDLGYVRRNVEIQRLWRYRPAHAMSPPPLWDEGSPAVIAENCMKDCFGDADCTLITSRAGTCEDNLESWQSISGFGEDLRTYNGLAVNREWESNVGWNAPKGTEPPWGTACGFHGNHPNPSVPDVWAGNFWSGPEGGRVVKIVWQTPTYSATDRDASGLPNHPFHAALLIYVKSVTSFNGERIQIFIVHDPTSTAPNRSHVIIATVLAGGATFHLNTEWVTNLWDGLELALLMIEFEGTLRFCEWLGDDENGVPVCGQTYWSGSVPIGGSQIDPSLPSSTWILCRNSNVGGWTGLDAPGGFKYAEICTSGGDFVQG